MKKSTIITGITSQRGAYLVDFLLHKGYEVHGIKRRTSLFYTDRIDYLYEDPHTANHDTLGTLRILEAIRILGLERKTRFYQVSRSELVGKVQEIPQKETTPFYPAVLSPQQSSMSTGSP